MGNQKQTNKFDVYMQFLDNLIKRNTIELNDIQKKVALYKAISSILEKRSRGELVSNYHYAELAKLSCPDKTLINLFVDSDTLDRGEGFFNYDYMLSDCPSTNCSNCWKNYINTLVEIIYKSDAILKLIDFVDYPNPQEGAGEHDSNH